MDADKVALLFGRVPASADPDDPDDRALLLSDQFRPRESLAGGFRLALYETVASQIVDGDPPAVWETARRLLAMGEDRRRVLHELVLTLNGQIEATLRDKRAFDAAAYAAALDRLPLPTVREMEAAMVAIVRDRQPIAVDELESLAMGRLGLPVGEEPYESLLDWVGDHVFAPDGPLAMLAGDRVVEPESLCEGIVLTHRLTEVERATACIPLGADLVGFARQSGPLRTSSGEQLEPSPLEDGDVAWRGPDDWLSRFPAGTLLAVRLLGEQVGLEALDREPPLDAGPVAGLRSAYDAGVAELGLPVDVEDLLLELLIGDREAFGAARPPLSELCRAAGLELRAGYAAHDRSVWEKERALHRANRVADLLERDGDRETAWLILECLDEGTEDPDRLDAALAGMREPHVLEVVIDEALGLDDDPDRLEATAAFSERLLAAARRPAQIAVARWLATVVAERRGEPLAGEAHLRRAVEADGEWGPAVDRLAWYLSDRGDAVAAVRLWRRLGFGPEENDDLAVLEPFARQPGPKLGRNEPCWCGSGRKFKLCHLGRPVGALLPDRVGWLCRKAVAYLERRGGAPAGDVRELALLRAGDDADDAALSRALEDPLVIDLALHELEWFGRFLTERGPLLPEDEALLAASWALVDRTVYEIVGSEPGIGVVVRDLRTAERLDVRERTFSHRARPLMLVCGRAVPDGETHQFVGGLFSVAPGTEVDLLDLLEENDAHELARYVAVLDRPPTLHTREGEPLVACTAVLEVPDPGAAKASLDRRYRGDEPDTWVEVHTIDGGDEVLRATLSLDRDRLTVETMSVERLERVLSVLLDAIEGARVVADDRRPFDASRALTDSDRPLPVAPDDPAVRAAMEAWRDRQELRWCDEPIPALAGLTPRQAAADPTRREALERLLASFDDRSQAAEGEGVVVMRPGRLRRVLGLDA